MSLQAEVCKDNFWTSQAFFQAKRDEQQAASCPVPWHSLQPRTEFKSQPWWSARYPDHRLGGEKNTFNTRTMRELVAYQYLTEDEYQELMECEAYLWQMRFALHLESGRNENRILFDYQPAVAKRLGFGDDGKASVERMMKRFFRTVQRVSELNDMLLQHFEGSILK